MRFDAPPAVTGVGVICPLGLSRAETLAGLRAGQSAIGPIQRFDASTFPWAASAEVTGFVPRKVLPDRKAIKLMSPPARLAVAAALEALDHSRYTGDREDAGLYVAAGYETIDLDSVLHMMSACRPEGAAQGDAEYGTIDVLRLWNEARYRLNPLNALKILPNMALAHVSIATGMRGPNSAIGPHGSSGLQALGDAALAVSTGEAPFALAGGADSPINVFMSAYFGVEGLLSESGRCAPFAPEADGTVLGEAAAFVAVEPAEAACARDARPLATILATGQAHAAGRYGPPRDPEPYLRAGQEALQDAGIDAADVARWVADGWGVPEVDAAESAAARELFGDALPARRATKGLLGHCFAAAGSLEVALSCADPASGPELIWSAGVDGTVAAVVLSPAPASEVPSGPKSQNHKITTSPPDRREGAS